MNKYDNLLRKIKSKKILLIIALSLVFVIGFTWAFFSNSYAFNNKFNVANYDVQIEEVFNGTWGVKQVSIVNKDETPVVLRVSYNEMWKLIQEDESIIFLSNRLKINDEYIDVVDKGWTEAWLKEFELGNDGWYYYKRVLTEAGSSNERVQILESIYLNDDVKTSPKFDDYLQAMYELDFNFEAVQATPKAIKSLWGDSVESVSIDKDNNVEWTLK